MLLIFKKLFIFQTRDVGTPFDINANLLALTRNGNNTFVRLVDLNTLESNESRLLEGLFISLQIVFIASAP